MSDLIVEVIKPGLFSTLQDQGRNGFQTFGVPVSGALDRKSASLANWLVGNDKDQPVIEITVLGPELTFSAAGQLALTGANLHPLLNGRPIPQDQTIDFRAGAVLTFGKSCNGCRSYLAIAGEWKVERWLGSACAVPYTENLMTTSRLEKEQQILIESRVLAEHRSIEETSVKKDCVEVRILEGPEFSLFTDEALNSFLEVDHVISKDVNRMGMRLKTRIDFCSATEMISSGVIPGTIQIARSGQPIILLADAQTTGGYPRIANVIGVDMDLLAQCRPGDTVRFHLVGLQEAYDLFHEAVSKEARESV